MGLSTIPAAQIPTGSGFKFGSPTTFNTTGTYTIPNNATENSSIMVESISGGSGAGSNAGNLFNFLVRDLQTVVGSPFTETSYANNQGAAGSGLLGIYRLGFFSSSPAGQNITVTVGAGGTGAIIPAFTSSNLNSAGQSQVTGATAATTGGTSSLTYSGGVFASAAVVAQAANANANTTTWNSGGAVADTTFLTALGPKAGTNLKETTQNISTNTATVTAINSAAVTGRTDYGTAADAPYSALINPMIVNVNATGDTTNVTGTAATGTAFQPGQPQATYVKLPSGGNYTLARGGTGGTGAGGGSGLGMQRVLVNFGSGAYNTNAHQVGGSGGSGRVRIWFQE
jgi:hypothetical protein